MSKMILDTDFLERLAQRKPDIEIDISKEGMTSGPINGYSLSLIKEVLKSCGKVIMQNTYVPDESKWSTSYDDFYKWQGGGI